MGIRFTTIIAVLLLALCGDLSGQARSARRGVVRGDGHAFVDDGGPFLARGATLFWALWGYRHDRARLARNLETLRDWGFDYIRVLGVVGDPGDRPGPVCGPGVANCDSWRDRRLDPTAPDYARDIAGFTDWAYREYGLRVQWTIFGGTGFAPTTGSRRAIVDMFAGMGKGREQAIFAFEVANEASHNGFSGAEGRNELRELGRVLKSSSSNLVALSSPNGTTCAAVQELYGDSAADLMTLHIGRVGPRDGEHWNALADLPDLRTCKGVPALASSNEPIGPESSVVSLDDPVALSAIALATYGSGIGAFVLHTGPGVRGGGGVDVALGRHGNLWELPTAARIAGGLATLAKVLPGDFANWSEQDGLSDAADRLFDVKDRAALTGLHCFSKPPEFACAPVGIKQPVTLVARRNMTATVHDFVNGTTSPSQRLTAGGALSLPATPAAALIAGRLE